MSQHLGYTGSFLAHAALVAVALAFAVTLDPVVEPPRDDGVVITPGNDGGTGAGHASGSRATPKPADRFLPLPAIDADKVLRDYAESVRRAEAEARARAVAAAGVVGRPPVKPRPSTAVGNAATAPGATRAIIGATVPAGDSAGPVGSGSSAGAPGREGDALATWSDTVRSAFAAAYVPRVRALGARVADDARGVVRIRVSAAGVVAFDGWQEAPAELGLASAVRQAVGAMGPVPAPPSGATVVVVPFVAKVDGP